MSDPRNDFVFRRDWKLLVAAVLALALVTEIATAAVSLSLSQTETAKDSGQLPKIRPPRLAASSVPFTNPPEEKNERDRNPAG
jgi:hypothetical protein